MSRPTRAARTPRSGVKIVFAGQRRRETDALLLQHQSRQRRLQERAASEILRELGPGDSFIKSASYLLHWDDFSQRARLPAHQQRDPGAGRFRHSACLFRRKKWELASVRPLSRADRRISGPLPAQSRDLFRKSQPIDFGVGYRWRPHESNLLLARRKEVAPGEAIEATADEPPVTRPRKRRATAPPLQSRPPPSFFIFR